MERVRLSGAAFERKIFVENYKYALVIKPEQKVYEKFVAAQHNFFAEYGYMSKKQEPWIWLARFTAKEEMEETIIRWMQRICKSCHSFTAEINNYSGFPPGDVYLRIQDHKPFIQLTNQLKVVDNYIQSNGCPPALFNRVPSVTIAHNLSEEQYLSSLLASTNKLFHETLLVEQLVLIRKAASATDYKTVHIFPLQPSVQQ